MIDLVCLVADKNIEAAVGGLLRRRQRSLGIRPVHLEIHVHPRRDPGCFHEGPTMLAGLIADHAARGLLVFDQAWEGNPHDTAASTEASVRESFRRLGIAERAAVVVIEPEIEAWVWSASPHVARALGWAGARPSLRSWLADTGLWPDGLAKPPDPKEAMERALQRRRIPRSSALYRELAHNTSLKGCQDAAFGRLRRILQGWFPPDGGRASGTG